MAPRVWCRCESADSVDLVATLQGRLAEDGDAVDMIVTGSRARPNPATRRDAKALIDSERPGFLIWIGDPLDLPTLLAAQDAGIGTVLVNVTEAALTDLGGFFQRGRLRSVLGRIRGVFTPHDTAVRAFALAGVPTHLIHANALLEPPIPILPYREQDRRDIADALNNRSVWLAASVTPEEVDSLAEAHRQATRRSHRLLLVVNPAEPSQGSTLADSFAKQFLQTVRSQDDPIPQEAAQVHVADADNDLGLWLRLASVTLAGATLSGRAAQDPFQIATLGSGLIHGPNTQPYGTRYARLDAAGATRPIRNWTELGQAVEDLLAADRVAVKVAAGWDVTSQGAETAEAVTGVIRDWLDRGAA